MSMNNRNLVRLVFDQILRYCTFIRVYDVHAYSPIGTFVGKVYLSSNTEAPIKPKQGHTSH